MKKILLSLCLIISVFSGRAQISPDFTATDCNGISHNLYSELNAGKVIVLVWVMPCSVCVNGAMDANYIVQGYQASYPNKVYMYLCDDLANDPCDTLDAWQSNLGLVDVIQFSDSAINMTNYGLPGMPKVVVIGGSSHTVFYNTLYGVNDTAMQNAIQAALTITGTAELNNSISSLKAVPNPAAHASEIQFNLTRSSHVTAQLLNLEGQFMEIVFSGQLAAGENNIKLELSSHPAGMYLVKISDGDKVNFMNVMVTR